MTLLLEIQKELKNLPLEKQNEVLNFVLFLRQRTTDTQPPKQHSLKNHSAFGSWQARNIDAVAYQQALRAEWDEE